MLNNEKEIPTYITYDDVLLLPNYSEILPPQVSLKTNLTPEISLDIPILSAPMDTVTELNMLKGLGSLGGLGIIHRNLSIADQADLLKQALDTGIRAGAAVGIGTDFKERVDTLIKLKPTVLCLDSAHGHTKNVLEGIRYIKEHYPEIIVISGNVATYEGARASFEAGADIVKVGMGSGSICTTRIMSGVGVPQLSAIMEAKRAALEFNKSIIADGGIRTSGDIVKALAAGASAVMLGSLLAGTKEAVGDEIQIDGQLYKCYRGMGSRKSMAQGSATRYGQTFDASNISKLVPEGVEGLLPYSGELSAFLHQILGGLRAGFAYLGAENISQLQEKAKFIRISEAGKVESKPHTIIIPQGVL